MLRIITDSAADFEPNDLEKLNVFCAPIAISFGDTEYKENIDITKDRFYELLQGCDKAPTTSQPSPEYYMEFMEETQKNGDDCLIITLSSALSGTYQTVQLIKQNLEYENCCVFDSLSATAGQRLLVEAAVKMRDEGKSLNEVVSELEVLRSKVSIIACIDTLEYLHKGGRISGLSYTLGTAMNIKPIISVNEEGKIAIPAKVMGRVKGSRYMLDWLEDNPADTNYPVYLVYTCEKENALKFAELLKKSEQDITPSDIYNIGVAIGAHVGPGAVGLVYIKK